MLLPSLGRVLLGTALAGAAIGAAPALASAASTCTLDETTHAVRIVDGSGDEHLNIVQNGTFIAVRDGVGPVSFCPGPSSWATVTNTDRVDVLGTAASGRDGYIVDESHGVLGPGRTLEDDGNSEIEVAIRQLDGQPVTLAVVGTAGPDTIRVAAGDAVALGTDPDFDITMSDPAHHAYQAKLIEVAGLGGADFLSGRGVPGSVLGEATVPVALFGGMGGDTLAGGAALGDTVDGGGDNDTLFSADGLPDWVTGGPGFDSARVDKLDSPLEVESKTVLPV